MSETKHDATREQCSEKRSFVEEAWVWVRRASWIFFLFMVFSYHGKPHEDPEGVANERVLDRIYSKAVSSSISNLASTVWKLQDALYAASVLPTPEGWPGMPQKGPQNDLALPKR